jgi:hypothetical protein
MTFLSDDLLEGRFTGSRGYRIAAAYVATRFQAFGLEPAGESKSYYQEVPLRRADLDASACSARLRAGANVLELVAPRDLLFSERGHRGRLGGRPSGLRGVRGHRSRVRLR